MRPRPGGLTSTMVRITFFNLAALREEDDKALAVVLPAGLANHLDTFQRDVAPVEKEFYL